jgi:tetratricopeptide (TPR) repeat protein
VTAQKSGDLAEAERQYLKALKRRKDHSETITNLSAVYIKQNKYAEAEEILKRLDKSSPTNAKALVNLGTIHLHGKQENDPIAREIYYQKVLDLFPDNQDILFAYASFCETKHRYGDALGYYRRGLALERVRSDARLRQIVSNRVQLLESMVSGKSTVNSGK